MDTCTIVAHNYLAQARVLARSLRSADPSARLWVLVLDDPHGTIGADAEPFELLRPSQLGLEPRELHRMATIYDLMELATALKPWLLTHLLDRGAEAVVYLDPDIEVFGPLDEAARLAVDHGIVLTPHTVEPMARDGRQPSEAYILRAGVYNLGFVAVGQSARGFLDWWASRLRRDCVVAVEEGLFVDQRWVDFVPGYFPLHILRDPGYNVAYWNLDQRPVRRAAHGYEAGGRPLRFFHFSGFDPETPHLLSRHAGSGARVLLSEQPVVRALCAAYAGALEAAGYRALRGIEYGYARSATGFRLDSRMRRLYRDELLEVERAGGSPDELPDPFTAEGAQRFIAWLNEPAAADACVSRYLSALHADREDVRAAHPRLDGEHAQGFLDWVRAHGWREHALPDELVPARSPLSRPRAVAPLQRGVNVVGYLRAENGVGEAARMLLAALEHSDVPAAVVPLSTTATRQEGPAPPGPRAPEYDVNVVCVNADEFGRFAAGQGADILEDRYTIGMWAWEVDRLPAWMAASAQLVDEIWVGSAHSAEALARSVDRPVLVLPLPIVEPLPAPRTRADLGLPDGFLVLYCFDFASVFERKNPLAAVRAFSRAFPPGSGAHLVVKTVNGDRHLPELELLRAQAAERPDVHVVDGFLQRADQHALMAACDVYLSLHRAEGFGLTMAEAMALGKPVVATGYSGNLEFMGPGNSLLVGYELVPVGPGNDPYPPEARWAEPDVEEAAAHLARLRDDPAAAARIAARARAHVLAHHGPAARGRFLVERLETIRRTRRGGTQPRPLGQSPPALPAAVADATAPEAHALDLAAAGPDHRSPSRYGWPAQAARRLLLRATHHTREHQQRIDAALFEALRGLRADLGQVAQRLADLDGRAQRGLGELGADLDRFSAQRDDLADDLGRSRDELERVTDELACMADDLSAVPFTSDPAALLTTDDDGRETIGYRGQDGPPLGGYAGFEDLFRGSEELIRDRLRCYLPLLAGHAPVADLGCGRGELLDLLAAAQVPATGVDVDPGMVARAAGKGHGVVHADALAWLDAQPDGALGAVFSAQFVEHLAVGDLRRLFEAAHRVLRPGGLLVAETVNPHSVRALKTFWLDLTHVQPLFPEALVALCGDVGYQDALIRFPHGSGKLWDDRRTQGEYALVATKAGR